MKGLVRRPGTVFHFYVTFLIYIEVIFIESNVIMRVGTDLLLSASAATASYTFKNFHLRLNCNLAVSRDKTNHNVFFAYHAGHMDLIIVLYRVFDWRTSRAIFHFILFRLIFVGS